MIDLLPLVTWLTLVFPTVNEILILKNSRILLRSVCAYQSLDAQAVGSGDNLASAPSELWLAAMCAARDACQPIPNFHIHFAVGRASARIRLSLRINILLTIGVIYKMERTFRLSLVHSICS